MTLPNLTSTTAELIAYRDELRDKLAHFEYELSDPIALGIRDHWYDLLLETLDELNRRESCTHEDFTENLAGRTCRTCGLETK